MKLSSNTFRIFRLALYFSALTGVIMSCETRTDMIPKSELLTLPSVTVKNLNTQFTDSGRLQLKLLSPILEQYTNKESPYSEFRLGIKAYFFDGKPDSVASVSGKYAKYINKDNLWELKDSVIVINQNNDKLETEELFWDQTKDLIYTDRFVKITSEDQIIQGFGFESDPRLKKRKIKKVTATITLDE
jgi:LPS export ABC transporter protein LptC